MTTAGRRGAGPSWRALGALLLAALALLATSQGSPRIEKGVTGEVVVDPGGHVDRTLHVHLAPEAHNPAEGRVTVQVQSANGLFDAFSPTGPSVKLAAASDTSGPFPPSEDVAQRCSEGCDLVYTIRVDGGRDVLPGSVVRYSVDVSFAFGSGPQVDAALLSLTLDGSSPVAVTAIVAPWLALLALLAGVAIGPAVDRRLGRWRRRPAQLLTALLLSGIAWAIVRAAAWALPLATGGMLGLGPLSRVLLLDPFAVGLFVVLALGMRRGLRRWPEDGGWMLGIAAVAATVFGGVWLAITATSGPAVQPIGLILMLSLAMLLGGVVIGQAWRVDRLARHGRGRAATAVIAHGLVIAACAAFVFLTLGDTYRPNFTVLVLVVPAVLVGIGFRRWLSGRVRMLRAVDILIALVGLALAGAIWIAGHSFGASGFGTLEATAAAVAIVPLVALASGWSPPATMTTAQDHAVAVGPKPAEPTAGLGAPPPSPDPAEPPDEPQPTS